MGAHRSPDGSYLVTYPERPSTSTRPHVHRWRRVLELAPYLLRICQNWIWRDDAPRPMTDAQIMSWLASSQDPAHREAMRAVCWDLLEDDIIALVAEAMKPTKKGRNGR